MNTALPPHRSDTWCAAAVSAIGRALQAVPQLTHITMHDDTWHHRMPQLRASVAAHLLFALRAHVHAEDWVPMAKITVIKLGQFPLQEMQSQKPLLDLLVAAESRGFNVGTDFVVQSAGPVGPAMGTFLRTHGESLLKAVIDQADAAQASLFGRP